MRYFSFDKLEEEFKEIAAVNVYEYEYALFSAYLKQMASMAESRNPSLFDLKIGNQFSVKIETLRHMRINMQSLMNYCGRVGNGFRFTYDGKLTVMDRPNLPESITGNKDRFLLRAPLLHEKCIRSTALVS